ncbi:MAG: pyrroline-5-carboxylate reductase [Gemmataceae bacterium]|nr:pyrroline-5-carboxylate reductase [Gemmataceae bacterium]
MADTTRFGFIGAGKMATALARGWVAAGLARPGACIASDPMTGIRDQFAAASGARVVADNLQVVGESDTVVLAVKPQSLPEVLAEIRPAIGAGHLVISIAAGVTLGRLESLLGPGRRLVRVMPNTACQVQAGAAAYAGNNAATPADLALTDRLFNTGGIAFSVPEKLLDAVTGLSGSGPAFVFAVIEAMSDGGVLAGLPRDIATRLAAQTVLGAARMALETGLHPGELKDLVTSPGGTTIAGMHALERAGVRAGLIDAVAAAARRSEELGAGT